MARFRSKSRPPLGSTVNWGHPLASGLTGCFLFNEGAGTKLFNLATSNETGINSVGVISGTTWQTKMAGSCINFAESASDHVIVSDICNAVTNLGRMSVLACVQRNNATSGTETIVGKEASASANGWTLQFLNTNVGQFGVFGSSSYPLVAGVTAITDLTKPVVIGGTKHSANGYSIYVNGILDATAANGATPTSLTNPLTFGSNSGDTSLQLFNGKIFWCYIWSNRCLTTSDIQSLYVDPYQFIGIPRRRRIPSSSPTGLVTSLTAYYKLEEASGTRFDSFGSNHLTDNNTVTQAAGKIANAAAFAAASSEYLSIADNAAMSTGNIDFTITAWIYLNDNTAERYFAAKSGGTAGTTEFYLFTSGSGGDDRIKFGLRGPTDNTNLAASSFGAVPSTTWIFVAAWHDATANTMNIQINGGTVDSTAYADGPRDAAVAFSIGSDGVGTNTWEGRVDEYGFWKRLLTSSERTQLYNNGVGLAYDDFDTVVDFDAASNSGYQAAQSTYSWNHTCSGIDRYLVVGVSMLSLAQTVTGITYAGVAMTSLGSRNSVTGACRVELWGLIAPTSGTNSIAVTLSGSIASAGCATSFTGVHQTSPTEAFNSAQATNVGAADATVDVTTVATNDWVIDIVATDDTAITVGAGQASRANVTGAGGSGAMSTEGPKNPAGAVTMSWTSVAALATWATGSIAIRPVSASTLITGWGRLIGLFNNRLVFRG